LTQRGRVDIEIHGNGSEYDSLDLRFRQNFRGGVTEYPTKPSIQELLLPSMQTLPIRVESDFEAEFRGTLSDWKNDRDGYHLSNPNNWRVEPGIYEGVGINIVDILYRHLLEDNPSQFRKVNIYLPSNYAEPQITLNGRG
jgi:hypothetical protein